MSSMLIKWLRLTQELKENPGCYNNRGFYFPPQSRMLTKSWDEENAPATMMMRERSGRQLFKFIRFQMLTFPERHVKSFEECIIQLDASIDDLFASHHLLIEWLKSKEPAGKLSASCNSGSLRSSRFLPAGVKLY